MEFQDVSPQLEKLANEFQYKDPPEVLLKLQELFNYVLRAIVDFLKQFKLTIGLGDTSGVGNVMQVAIILVGLVCIAAVTTIVFSRMKQLRLKAELAKSGALEIEEILDSAGWRKRSEELASQGRFKEACRALYLSILYLMDEKKILPFAPTRTNYEYCYALTGRETLQRGFRRLSDLVEIMWFGNHIAKEGDYKDCLELQKGLEADILAWSQSNVEDQV